MVPRSCPRIGLSLLLIGKKNLSQFRYFFSCEAQKYGITVWVANYDYYSDDDGEFTVNAEEIIIHPNYGADNVTSNDICLLRVPTLSEQKPGFYLN